MESDEWCIAAWSVGVDDAGGQRFSRASGAGDEDWGIGGAGVSDIDKAPLDRWGSADDLAEGDWGEWWWGGGDAEELCEGFLEIVKVEWFD